MVQIHEKPEDGVYVYGLYLEGAKWDREQGQLGEQAPKVLTDSLPCVHLLPVDKAKKATKPIYVS